MESVWTPRIRTIQTPSYNSPPWGYKGTGDTGDLHSTGERSREKEQDVKETKGRKLRQPTVSTKGPSREGKPLSIVSRILVSTKSDRPDLRQGSRQ